MTHVDTLVIGAGPAGAAAAIRLASDGREVLVVDKARFPRDKICGDGLTTGALRLLESLGVDLPSLPSVRDIGDVTLRGPAGREHRFALPEGPGTFAAVVPRIELDAAIVERARRAGAEVADGHAMAGVTVDPSAVRAEVDGIGEVTADHLVAADGMWSPTRRMLGLTPPDYRGELHAFRQYVEGVSDRASRELFISFEEDLLPGYFWSFPLPDGGANVGYGILRDHGPPVATMTRLWADLLGRSHIVDFLGSSSRPLADPRAWPIPARVGRLPTSATRTLFVGDATGACDVMTGEGIGQALATGIAAAEAIIGGGDRDPSTVTTTYDEWIRRTLVPDDSMSRRLSTALSYPLGARVALAVAGASDWTRRNFIRWLFEDYPRGIALTPRSWRRGLLTGPAAYRDGGVVTDGVDLRA